MRIFSHGAAQTGNAAGEVRQSADAVVQQGNALRDRIARFIEDVRAA